MISTKISAGAAPAGPSPAVLASVPLEDEGPATELLACVGG